MKVPSDVVKQLNDNSQQSDNRLAYSSNTNNVNNSRIVPEDVDKDVSLQIESEFDEVIDEITDGLKESTKKLFENNIDNSIGYYSNTSYDRLDYDYQSIVPIFDSFEI